jgi:general nucleoside transport system permease protein
VSDVAPLVPTEPPAPGRSWIPTSWGDGARSAVTLAAVAAVVVFVLNDVTLSLNALGTAIDGGAVVVLAGMGGLLMERAGVLCLGLEGIVAIGAVGAVVASGSTDDVWLCLAASMFAGALLGLVFGLATVVARANQVLIGLAVVLIGTGLANNLGREYAGRPMTAIFRDFDPPLVGDTRLGDALLHHDPLIYGAYLLVPFGVWFFLMRTRWGLNLRAIGDHPAAADTTGVSVLGWRFAMTIVGGALAGAGGATLSMSFTPGWSPNLVSGKGWVALAVIVFAAWKPFRLVFGALLFGAMISVSFLGQSEGWDIDSALLNMLPYVVTLVLPLVSKRFRQAGTRPSALAVPYFREER